MYAVLQQESATTRHTALRISSHPSISIVPRATGPSSQRAARSSGGSISCRYSAREMDVDDFQRPLTDEVF